MLNRIAAVVADWVNEMANRAAQHRTPTDQSTMEPGAVTTKTTKRDSPRVQTTSPVQATKVVAVVLRLGLADWRIAVAVAMEPRQRAEPTEPVAVWDVM